MKLNKILAMCAAVVIASPTAVLAEDKAAQPDRVEIEWQNPKEFTDVKAANGHRGKFRDSTFAKLEKHLEKLAEHLPEGTKLKMTVTDLDLAGKVWPGHFSGLDTTSDVRVVKRIDIPRMNFSYELVDANGTVVKSGEENLKDMAFQDRLSKHRRHDSLRYEKTMLKNWFSKEFGDQLIAKN